MSRALVAPQHSKPRADGRLGAPPPQLVRALGAIRSAGLHDLLQVCADMVLELVGGDVAAVSIREDDGDHLVLRAVSGGYPGGPTAGFRVPLTNTLAGAVLQTGTGHVCLDSELDPRTQHGHNAALGLRSSVAAPLRGGDDRLGVVSVLSRRPGTYDLASLQLLELVCGTVSDRLSHLVSTAGADAFSGTVLDALDEAVLVTQGEEMRVVLGNRALEVSTSSWMRLTPGMLVTQTPWRLSDEDGRPVPFAVCPAVVAWRTGREVRDQVLQASFGDGGDQVWLSITSLPVLDPLTHRVVSVVTRLRDVTHERRDREQVLAGRERLHAAQAVAGLAWWEYDVTTDRYTWSEQMFHLVGLDPSGEAPDADHYLALVDPADRPAADPRREAGETRSTVADIEIVRLTRPDGTRRVLQTWSEHEHSPSGELVRVHGATMDVTEREQATESIARRDAQFRMAFDNSPIGMALLDVRSDNEGRMLRANPALVRLLGYDDEHELLGSTVERWTVPEDVPRDAERLRQLCSGELTEAQYEKRYRRRDGTTVNALLTTSVSGQGTSSPVLLCHVLDLTERERAARAVAANEQQFRVAFEDAPSGMMLVSASRGSEGVVLRANQALADMVQRSAHELVGTRAQDFLVPEDVRASFATLARVAATGEDSGRVSRRIQCDDGSVRDVWCNSIVIDSSTAGETQVLTHVVDVTAQRRQQRALERLALTDTVTGLANRSQLADWVDAALSRIDGDVVALLMLDLDRFKTVNDSLGHHVGDDLLVQVARRLQVAARDRWSVARLGGDEFVVLVEQLDGGHAAEEVAREVLELLAEPFKLGDNHRMTSTVSIGIAVASEPTHTRENLLREADLALYAAKDGGRNRFAVCDNGLRNAVQLRLDTESGLRRAIDERRLEVHLQPVVLLEGEGPASFEALVRLVEPGGRVVLPGEFIGIAEDTGLVVDIDLFVLAESLRLLGSHPALVVDPSLRLSVNLSVRTLQHPGLADAFAAGLAENGVPGSRLTFEITERSMLEDDPQVHETMRALRALGARLAIDDFGTGYSALAYLRAFDLQQLKIDRSFVNGLRSDVAAATVQAIIDLAHAHSLEVVAEGVEEQWQADQLLAMGCDQGQGWLFGRPARPAGPQT